MTANKSLDTDDRKDACVEYDHPLRQYHNRGVWGGGLWATPASLSWEQRRLLTDLLYAGLSELGRQRVPNEFYTNLPGVHSMRLLVCGNPKRPPYQIILTGAHLNVRVGGRSREGAAFGGPLVYGDQRGDFQPGLPGNLYQFQFHAAHRLFNALTPQQKHQALVKHSPVQTALQLQGTQGTFPGLQIKTLSGDGRALTRDLIDGILSTYPAEDVAYAWECLEHNGGPEELFLSYYEDSERERSGQHQNFRLEGPSAVFHFRGDPHVHAFINVAMDGDAPLSVGEALGNNPTQLEGLHLKRLFESALQAATGSDFAYYHLESVAGRLQKGPIRTGDLYALESWQDSITTVEITGANMSPHLVAELRGRGVEPSPHRPYTVATATHVADEASEVLGTVDVRHRGGLLREAVISYVKKNGFPREGAATAL